MFDLVVNCTFFFAYFLWPKRWVQSLRYACVAKPAIIYIRLRVKRERDCSKILDTLRNVSQLALVNHDFPPLFFIAFKGNNLRHFVSQKHYVFFAIDISNASIAVMLTYFQIYSNFVSLCKNAI